MEISLKVTLISFPRTLLMECSPVSTQCRVSGQFSHSVVSNSLQAHEPQHARPPCPSPTPRVYSNSCPLNWWCHPTISSSVIPFSSCPQSFPASGSFQMSQFFTSGGQSKCRVYTSSISSSLMVFYKVNKTWTFVRKYCVFSGCVDFKTNIIRKQAELKL